MKRTDCITDLQAEQGIFPERVCDNCGELKCTIRPPTLEEYDECIELYGFFPENTAAVICDDCFTNSNKLSKQSLPAWLKDLTQEKRDYLHDVSIQEELQAATAVLQAHQAKQENNK